MRNGVGAGCAHRVRIQRRDRERQQREIPGIAFPVGGSDLACCGMFGRIEARDGCRELFENLCDAFAPVGAAHDDHEIIAADMANEIQPRREAILQQA